MTILIKGLDVFEMIKNARSFTELKMIRDALGDEAQTVMMSNKSIHYALKLIKDKINSMDKDEMIREILEGMLW